MTASEKAEMEKLDLYNVYRNTVNMDILCRDGVLPDCYLTFVEFLTLISKFSM